jgi:hypothetical protein
VLAAQGKKVGLVDMDLCGKWLGRVPGLGFKAEGFGFMVQALRQGRGTRSRAALPWAHRARQQTRQRGESETRVDARTERERERERREREPESSGRARSWPPAGWRSRNDAASACVMRTAWRPGWTRVNAHTQYDTHAPTHTGPSVARVLGLEDRQVLQSSEGWVPVRHGVDTHFAGDCL